MTARLVRPALLGLALLAPAAAGAAEKITASVGGYFSFGIVYQNQAGTDEVGVLRDGEIHFKWKGTSDNGLTFDGRVELEGFTTADQIDENWARVAGPWGSLLIGSDDTAANKYAVGFFESPDHQLGYMNSRQADVFNPSSEGDHPTIRYTTPKVAGFSAAIDWAPSVASDGLGDSGLEFGTDYRASFGAGYEAEFGEFSVSLGGGYVYIENTRQSWQLGGEVGYKGFEAGVYYDEDGFDNTFSSISVGGRYATGPWTFALGWTTTLDGPDFNLWSVWATYALAPGVSATLAYEGSDDAALAGGFDTTVAGYLYLAF